MSIEHSQKQSNFLSNRFESLVENGLDCVIIISATTEPMYVSRSIMNILGYTPDEVMKMDIMTLVHPDNVEGNHETIAKAIQNPGVPIQGHLSRVKHKNGSWVWIDAIVTNMLHDPAINGIVDNFRDVTDRVIAEEKLNESTQRLLLATQAAKIGIWEQDLINDHLEWDDIMFELYGVEKHSFAGKFESWIELVHPTDRETMRKKAEEAMSGQSEFDVEFSILKPDGSIRHIKAIAHLQKDSEGKPVRLIGTNWDITKSRKSNEKFKNLLETAPDAMIIVNDAGKIQLVNKQAEKLFGYSAEELFDKSIDILIPKRFSDVHNAHLHGFFSNPETRGMGEGKDLYGINKNGLKISVQISLSPLQTEEGLLISAAIRDITEQKLAENELLRKNQMLSIAEKITMIGNWQWDLMTNVVKWSANLYQIFRVEPNTALTYDTYFGFVHPADKEKVTQHVKKSLEDKKFIDLMHRIKLTDGTVKTIQLLAEIITDNKGNPIEMIGTCQDVTEQRMAENKFRGLLESAPDAMVIINEDNLIELVNSQTEKIFGYSKFELIGKPVDLLIPNTFQKNLFVQKKDPLTYPKTVKRGEESDLFAIKKDGAKFPVEINLGKLDTSDGLLISAAIRDITLRKKNEAMLRKMAAIEAKNEEMEQLAYITSHDLRAPLLTMKKYSEVLHKKLNGNLGEDETILLETIIRSADRMDEKITDLLDYSQLGLVKNLEKVDCNDLIKAVIEDLNALIESNDAQVITDDLPVAINAYPTELQLIFQNLINNAIKFKEKNIPAKVHITSKKIEEGWEFQVADNGIGIHEKDHKKIFSIFQKLHHATEYEGSGIGLAHVKKLVELHNGQIRVKSQLGKGTTFNFSILTENL